MIEGFSCGLPKLWLDFELDMACGSQLQQDVEDHVKEINICVSKAINCEKLVDEEKHLLDARKKFNELVKRATDLPILVRLPLLLLTILFSLGIKTQILFLGVSVCLVCN